MNHIGLIKSIDHTSLVVFVTPCISIDLRACDREITNRLHRDLLEEYNTAAVTIAELANNEVMHENMSRLPAHVILENYRMSNRGRLPAANTSGDFTGERRCASRLT